MRHPRVAADRSIPSAQPRCCWSFEPGWTQWTSPCHSTLVVAAVRLFGTASTPVQAAPGWNYLCQSTLVTAAVLVFASTVQAARCGDCLGDSILIIAAVLVLRNQPALELRAGPRTPGRQSRPGIRLSMIVPRESLAGWRDANPHRALRSTCKANIKCWKLRLSRPDECQTVTSRKSQVTDCPGD